MNAPRSSRWISCAAIVLTAGLLAAACGTSDDNNDATSDTTASSQATRPSKAELVVGTLVVGGGSGTAGGQASSEPEDSLQAWASWTNDHGGINGHPVRVVVKETAGDPAKAIAAVKELVENEHVLAILGQSDPATPDAWAEYITEKGVPVIGGQNYTAQGLTNPMYFMQSTTVLSLLYGQIAKFTSVDALKYGALYCSEAAACAQANPILQAKAPKAGVEYIFDQAVSASQPDFTAACVAAEQAGVTALQLNGVPVDRVVRDCARQGYKPVYGIVNEAPAQLELRELEGAVGNLPAFPAFYDGPETEDFHAAMEQYMPKITPTVDSSRSWLAGLAFAKAAANLPDNPTVQDVLNGLYEVKDETFGGLTPAISYGPAGQPSPQITCYFLFAIEKGEYVAPQGLTPECEPAD